MTTDQRYTMMVTYELVDPDGSRSDSTQPRPATVWASSAAEAEAKVERWAQKEFRRPGFTVVAHVTGAHPAP
jgi:hypothetical protein